MGSNEQDLFGLAPYMDQRLVVVSARAPIVLGPGSFAWYPMQFTPEGPLHEPAAAERSRDVIAAFLDEMVAEHGADPARVFVGGFSQGAIMSLYVALTRPSKVGGVVAMSGRLLPEAERDRAPDEELRGLPFLVQHGVHDQVLPIQHGRAIRDVLGRLPVDLTYHEYPLAHEVAADSLLDAATWLGERVEAPPRA